MYKNIKQFKISILLEKQNEKWSPWQYLGPLVPAVVTHKTHQPPRTSSPVATRSPLVTSECQVNTDLSQASFWNTVIWVAIKTFQAHSSKRSSCWEGMHVLKWRWNPKNQEQVMGAGSQLWTRVAPEIWELQFVDLCPATLTLLVSSQMFEVGKGFY